VITTTVRRNDTIYREVGQGNAKERYQVVFMTWIDEAEKHLPMWKKTANRKTATHAIIYDTRRLVIDKVNKNELFEESN